MQRSRLAIIVLGFSLAVVWMITTGPRQVYAQEPNHVAVVVRFSEDNVVAKCVAFSEEQISGYEALRRSGLSVRAGFDAQGGTMCSIDGLGCPSDNCFCRCKGGQDCIYWSYWHRPDESWEYARVGATSHMVSDKQVEGWSWGPGTISEAIEPPEMTYDQVCDSTENSAVATSGEERGFSGNWLQYLLFGGILGFIALALVLSQIRSHRA
jgi:hypothetical protein